MAETAPAAAPTAAPGAAKKKVKKPAGAAKARKSSGPSVSELIVKAVSASKERSGMSLAALKKAVAASGYDVEKNNSRLKLAVKSLVSKGSLLQTKGSGASGSFKLNKKQPESKKKSAPKSKKPAVKKPKKAVSAGVKKSPKKAKKPSAAATKKVAKSPKKPKAVKPKKVAKSPAKTKAVKPKVKKSPAKAAKPKKAGKGAPKKK
ncbi:histone H1-like [Microcaecilia unicolor]|uniref:Histone H1-like n=1 Tax=Microcaecilia unicolor TaxID=1415580 RepID=A0A6P7Z5C9_9AMPH|nr:histone H1-like [Microcaecilia unicolor]